MRPQKRKTNALVFVFSGAADVGELTELAVWQPDRRGIAEVSCLTSIGPRLKPATPG